MESELESVKKQQSSFTGSSSAMAKEEVSLLRYRHARTHAHTHTHVYSTNKTQRVHYRSPANSTRSWVIKDSVCCCTVLTNLSVIRAVPLETPPTLPVNSAEMSGTAGRH